MTHPSDSPQTWRTSSRSQSGADQNCVEVGSCTCHGIAVRDSKHPQGGTLTVGHSEWLKFIGALGRG